MKNQPPILDDNINTNKYSIMLSFKNLTVKKVIMDFFDVIDSKRTIKLIADELNNIYNSFKNEYKEIIIEEIYNGDYNQYHIVGKRLETNEEKEYRLKYFNDIKNLEEEIDNILSSTYGSELNINNLGHPFNIVSDKNKITWLDGLKRYDLVFEKTEDFNSINKKINKFLKDRYNFKYK